MKNVFWLFVCLLPLSVFAQEKGVHFEHGLSWQQVKAKAKAENKYIFMDCYTTWCGPCKYMTKNVFPQPEVGETLNSQFINVKMQLDTSDADNAEIKKLYATAHKIASDYEVNVYPTYLFFSPAGKLVHRAVGASDAPAFIAKTKEALNPESQYYTLLDKYNDGQKDSGFLYLLTKASMDAYDTKNGSRIAGEYLATQPDLYTMRNLTIIRDLTQSSRDTGFIIMLENPAKADSILGKGTSNGLVQNIIMREDVYPKMFQQKVATPKDLAEPDWNDISSTLEEKYPRHAASLLAYSKVVFYMNKNDWEQFGPAVVSYMKSFGENTGDDQLNSFAWTVFQNCSDETCLQNALEWSKRSFEKEQNPMFMDTYANILYRLGKTDEAIAWEQKAKDLAAETDKPSFQQTIDKMKNGINTWN